MRRAIYLFIVYLEKLRAMVWRVARRLRPCDRFSIPFSVILSQLRITRNKTRQAIVVSVFLLFEIKSDAMESCKMLKAL